MIWVATNVGCGLVTLGLDGKFLPDAAESWQVFPDGLLYTFKLRKKRRVLQRHPLTRSTRPAGPDPEARVGPRTRMRCPHGQPSGATNPALWRSVFVVTGPV